MVTINAATLPEVVVPAPPPTATGASRPEVQPTKTVIEAKDLVKNTEDSSAAKTDATKVSLEELTQATDQLERVAKLVNRSVHFRISEAGDDIQVLVINEDTDEVIREIPPDAVLELAERIQGTLGLLIDKVV